MSELHASSRRPRFIHRQVQAAAGFARRAVRVFGLATMVLVPAITLLPSPPPDTSRDCFPSGKKMRVLKDPEAVRHFLKMFLEVGRYVPGVRP